MSTKIVLFAVLTFIAATTSGCSWLRMLAVPQEPSASVDDLKSCAAGREFACDQSDA